MQVKQLRGRVPSLFLRNRMEAEPKGLSGVTDCMMLQNKTVVITGAAGGLGEGIARVCHREGANIVIADLNGERAASSAKDLRVRALAVVCDVRKPDQLSHSRRPRC